MKTKYFLVILFSFMIMGIYSCKQCSKPEITKEKKMYEEFYTCGRHPDITRADSGKCSKCGMKLVKIVRAVPDSTREKE